MGRRIGPGPCDDGLARRWRALVHPCACVVLAWSFAQSAVGIAVAAAPAATTSGAATPKPDAVAPAGAPTPAAAAADPSGAKKDRLLVEAKQLIYNRDTNVVSADGTVQLYYQGRVLEADKVIYDRNANRVFATGHAKMTEADGTVTYSNKFELTDDFKSGFVDSLSAITKDKTFFTSPRAERTEGETTTFEKGTYTACAPCAAHPERPPLWQVKAMKIIHKSDEQMIYFEDATIELYGVPIAYVPYFSTPDPTVTRKTGFLTPHYVTESRLGSGVAQPFFWNLAPNYDLTLTPTVLSQQGFLGEVEWRHRLETGSYTVLASGIYQLDPTAFSKQPFGTGDRNVRGSIESNGKFYINQNWKYGWDVALFSDKYFVQDYNIRSNSLGTDYIKESISTAYLTGQGDRSYFNLEGYRIQGLSSFDFNKQQPLVLPTVDYNRTFGLAPESTAGIGGEVNVDFNLTSLSRTGGPPHPPPAPGGRHPGGRGTLARLRFLALRRLPHVGDAEPFAAQLQATVLFSARHRRKLLPRFDPGQLATQVHRPHRRSLETLRLCAGRWFMAQSQHDGFLHVHERHRSIDLGQRGPEELLRGP